MRDFQGHSSGCLGVPSFPPSLPFWLLGGRRSSVRIVAVMAEIVGERNREKVDRACAIFKETAVAI